MKNKIVWSSIFVLLLMLVIIVIPGTESQPTYSYNREKTAKYTYSSGGKDYKMEIKIAIQNIHLLGIDLHYVMAKTKSYVKKHFLGIGYWWPYQTNVGAEVYGMVEGYVGNDIWQTVNCSSQYKYGYKSEIDAKVSFGTKIRVKTNWITGHFYCNGYNKYMSLNW